MTDLTDDSGLYQVEDGWIETFSGQRFYFMDPRPEMVHLVDIAQSLSQLCRYNGHTRGHYSVAEHSVLMARHIVEEPFLAHWPMTALLHDAAEAYIGDLPRPIKVRLPEFKRIEERIDAAVAEKFGTTHPFPPLIKELDTRILVDERAQVMPPSQNEWGTDGLEALGVEIEFWTPARAYDEFMRAFQEYRDL